MLIKMTKEIFCSTIFPKGTNTNLVEKLLVTALPVSPMHATSLQARTYGVEQPFNGTISFTMAAMSA